MKEKISNLIDVKSIITIMLTIVFCVLTVMGQVNQEFLTIYTVIISFYFGTQYQKGVKDKEEVEQEIETQGNKEE